MMTRRISHDATARARRPIIGQGSAERMDDDHGMTTVRQPAHLECLPCHSRPTQATFLSLIAHQIDECHCIQAPLHAVRPTASTVRKGRILRLVLDNSITAHFLLYPSRVTSERQERPSSDTLSSMATTENVYTGFWINRTDGRIAGATLTLGSTNGVYLIAFLAIVVRIAGGHFWQAQLE